jgi:hypothetical protein
VGFAGDDRARLIALGVFAGRQRDALFEGTIPTTAPDFATKGNVGP